MPYGFPYQDNDHDNIDDRTGMSYGDFMRATSEQRSNAEFQRRNRNPFVDEDGDGLHDRTGQTETDFSFASDRERDAAAENVAAQRGRDAYSEYESSGQRTADLDAGRTPMRNDGRGLASGSGGGGGGGAGGGGSGTENYDNLDQWQRDSAGTLLWGGISGANAAVDAARAQDAENRNRATWNDLANYAPTANDLAVDYGQEGYINGPKTVHMAGATGDTAAMEAERRALQGFEDVYRNGGMTAGDRARMQQGEAEMGRAMRSQREADMSSLRARGMGGSGAAIASTLGAQQAGTDMLAGREQQMQIAAQDRAMQALAGAGNMSGRMRASGWEEDTTRRGALDDFNRWNTDYERGREGRNQAWRAQTGESRSNARQQAYENRERQAAGATNQYSTDVSRRQNEGQRADQNDQNIWGAIGEAFDL